MNLESLEKQVLGHARRQMAPTPVEALRARQAVLAKLGGAAAGTGSVSAWGSLAQLKAGLVIAAALGIGGTAISFLRPQELPSPAELGAKPVASAKATVALLPPPRVSADRASADGPPLVGTLPSAISVPAAHGPGSPRIAPGSPRIAPGSPRIAPGSPRIAPPAPRIAPPAPTAARPTTSEQRRLRLTEEVRLLKQADSAIRKGEPKVARGLLEQLVSRYPKGQLLEERAATETLIRCQGQGPEAARAAADRFLTAHPQSVYTARIRATCAGFTFESEGAPVSGHPSSKEHR